MPNAACGGMHRRPNATVFITGATEAVYATRTEVSGTRSGPSLAATARTCAPRGRGVRPAARGKSPAAFDRRCIRPDGVASRSHTACMLPRRALLDRRIAVLGVTRGLATGRRGPRVAPAWGSGRSPDQGAAVVDGAGRATMRGPRWRRGAVGPHEPLRGVRGAAPTKYETYRYPRVDRVHRVQRALGRDSPFRPGRGGRSGCRRQRRAVRRAGRAVSATSHLHGDG